MRAPAGRRARRRGAAREGPVLIELPRLDGVSHRFVEAAGLRFHIAEAGEGPPLLMLHGWPQHWWMWRKVLPEVARSNRCIAPDLRGLGWTDAPPDGYEKRRLALDMLAVLDELGIDRVRVAGHDWGAMAGLLMAHEAPARVERLLMMSVSAPWDASYDPRRALPFLYVPALAAPCAERIVPAATQALLRVSGITGDDAEMYLRVLRQPERRRATVGYYRTFLTREIPEWIRHPLRRPPMPVRNLGGTRDPICRWSPSVEKIEGAGHFLPEDRPDAVIAAMHDFLGA